MKKARRMKAKEAEVIQIKAMIHFKIVALIFKKKIIQRIIKLAVPLNSARLFNTLKLIKSTIYTIQTLIIQKILHLLPICHFPVCSKVFFSVKNPQLDIVPIFTQ